MTLKWLIVITEDLGKYCAAFGPFASQQEATAHLEAHPGLSAVEGYVDIIPLQAPEELAAEYEDYNPADEAAHEALEEDLEEDEDEKGEEDDEDETEEFLASLAGGHARSAGLEEALMAAMNTLSQIREQTKHEPSEKQVHQVLLRLRKALQKTRETTGQASSEEEAKKALNKGLAAALKEIQPVSNAVITSGLREGAFKRLEEAAEQAATAPANQTLKAVDGLLGELRSIIPAWEGPNGS